MTEWVLCNNFKKNDHALYFEQGKKNKGEEEEKTRRVTRKKIRKAKIV